MYLPEELQAVLIEGFWRDCQLKFGQAIGTGDPDEFFWAWEEVDEAASQGKEGVVELLVGLSEAVADDDERWHILEPLRSKIFCGFTNRVYRSDRSRCSSNTYVQKGASLRMVR